MKCNRISSLAILVVLSGCYSGDSALLSTPLPNGYTFHSNGGETGSIKMPSGLRMASYFGIIDSQHEAWCKEFAWEKDYVVCIRSEYLSSSYQVRALKYFMLNTSNGEVELLGEKEARNYWSQKTGKHLPKMKTRYWRTSST